MSAVFLCMIGSFFYAFFFSEVILLITKLNQNYSQYQIKLEKLEKQLEANGIPKNLKNKIFDYFDFYWKKKKMFQDVSEFSQLSEPLKKEILFHLHKDIVINVPLFKELEPTELLQIIQRLK